MSGTIIKSKAMMECHVCGRVKIRRWGYSAAKLKKEGF